MNSYKIIWDNKEVGQLIDPTPDMGYLEGDWRSNKTTDADKFERMMMSLNARQVFKDLTKGLSLVLRQGNSSFDLNVVGFSLTKGRLLVRQVAKPLTPIRPRHRNPITQLLRFLRV